MRTDYKDKKFRIKHLLISFSFAFQGIVRAVRDERNLQIDFVFAIIVILFGFILRISPFEWLVLLLSIGGVVTAELVNTAVERIVNLVTLEFHPLAKEAKDIAAGAVLFFASVSVIIGLIIFLPKIWVFVAG